MSLPLRRYEPFEDPEVSPDPIRIPRRGRPTRAIRLGRWAGYAVAVLTFGIAALGLASSARTHDATLHFLAASKLNRPGSQTTLLSSRAVRRLGFVSVAGNLVNRSSHALHHVEAVVELVDSQDRTVALESGLILDDSLAAGASSAFCVEMQDSERAVAYRVHLRRLLGDRLD